jgi:hypothetical protein
LNEPIGVCHCLLGCPIATGYAPLSRPEMKEHPLRQVDLDQIGSFDGDDMTVVDMDSIAGMQPVCNLLAVVAGQYPRALTES